MAAADGFEKGDRILRLINLLRMFQAAPPASLRDRWQSGSA
jgi:hypothetical protein